jgi:hypothetical protein
MFLHASTDFGNKFYHGQNVGSRFFAALNGHENLKPYSLRILKADKHCNTFDARLWSLLVSRAYDRKMMRPHRNMSVLGWILENACTSAEYSHCFGQCQIFIHA